MENEAIDTQELINGSLELSKIMKEINNVIKNPDSRNKEAFSINAVKGFEDHTMTHWENPTLNNFRYKTLKKFEKFTKKQY